MFLYKLPFDFICPNEVEAEIADGIKLGYSLEFPSSVQPVSLNNTISPLAIASLDIGEAAVIQLALEHGIAKVCIDEVKGRRAAKAVGLSVLGSLGLIGKAKTLRIIPAVEPLILKAKAEGIYYDDELIEKFLRSMGE